MSCSADRRAPARKAWLKHTAHPPCNTSMGMLHNRSAAARQAGGERVPPPEESVTLYCPGPCRSSSVAVGGRAGFQSVLRVFRRSSAEPVSVFHASGSQQGCAAGSEVLAVREYRAKHPAHPRGSSGITYRGCSFSYRMVVGRTRLDGPVALFFLCVRTPTIYSLCHGCRTLAAKRRPGHLAVGPGRPRSHLRLIGAGPVHRCP